MGNEELSWISSTELFDKFIVEESRIEQHRKLFSAVSAVWLSHCARLNYEFHCSVLIVSCAIYRTVTIKQSRYV